MPVKTRPWDAAEFLTDDQDIRHYLEAAFEDGRETSRRWLPALKGPVPAPSR